MVAQRHPVERLGLCHRGVVMGHDQKLLIDGQPLEDAVEAHNIRIVERCIDLVQHVERTRIYRLQRKQEGERRQGPLAARQ